MATQPELRCDCSCGCGAVALGIHPRHTVKTWKRKKKKNDALMSTNGTSGGTAESAQSHHFTAPVRHPDVRLHRSWQTPTTPSENRWFPTYSPARETPLPSPAWQPIRAWTACAWRRARVGRWPLACSTHPAWSKASPSRTRARPTRAATCARGG